MAITSSVMRASFFLNFVLLLPLSTQHLNSSEVSAQESGKETPVSTESSMGEVYPRHRMKEKSNIILSGGPPVWYSPGDSILSSPDGKGPHCRREAKCERLNNTMCFGIKLPYTSTSLDLVRMTQEQVQEKLQFWMALKHVPRCWAVVQPILCALYMPRCENDKVDLPSQEMCKMALSPCRILELERGWTSPLRCDDVNRFPPMCKNDVRELRFNTTAQCLGPLVSTDNPSSFYEGTEGCGLQCANPMFTPDEHRQIHELIAWAGGICFAVNLFTVISFLIDWRSANKYPALIIFYINCCFLVACVGFLAQFLPGARESIVCKKDGTLRMSEPSAGENLSCVIVFVFIYYFLMAACVWFVILTYAWHLSFQALGKIQERIDKKGAYFHLVAWSLPLVLTITTMALGEIDGNSEMGVCFVGYMNPAARGGLLLGPIAVFYSTGGYFLLRGLVTLIKVKISSQEIISERASAKIRETIVRMGMFTLFTFVFVVVTFVVHIYEFQHRRAWKESFRTYMMCKIMRSGGVLTDGVGLTGHGDCRMEVRPSLAMVQLHLLALFTAGVVMSSWVWTSSTVDTWTRFIKRSFNQDGDEPIKMKKHKVIAQVFAKRQAFNRAGRISISIHSTHDDPVGLNFELNSAASQDMSSTWAAALPKLVTRRGALIGPATGSISSQYRNSLDSDFSYGVRRVSLESRRQSLDSQLSLALRDFTSGRKTVSTPVPPQASSFLGRVSGGRVKPRPKRKRPHTRRNHIGRRSSTTSQESQLGVQILSTLPSGNPNMPSLIPNLKRRTGNAGLDDDQLLPGTALAHAALFGVLDPSDDDASQAHSDAVQNISVVKNVLSDDQEDFEETLQLLAESKEGNRCRTDCQSRASRKNEELVDGGGDSFVSKSSKTSGKRGTRRQSEESLNMERKSSELDSCVCGYGRGSVCDERSNLNAMPENGVAHGNSKEDFQLVGFRCNKQELSLNRCENTINRGKRYNIISGNSSNEDESDEERGKNKTRNMKEGQTNSQINFAESRNKSDDKNSQKGTSDNGGTVCEDSSSLPQECFSSPQRSSQLNKSVAVSTLKHAREVGTQTSMSSGMNEIDLLDHRRPKSINVSTQFNLRPIPVKLKCNRILTDFGHNLSV